jgi:hypothetical protein
MEFLWYFMFHFCDNLSVSFLNLILFVVLTLTELCVTQLLKWIIYVKYLSTAFAVSRPPIHRNKHS